MILSLVCTLSSSVYANQPLSESTQALVRAQLWHEGIVVDSTHNSRGSFDSVTSYPEELTVAVDLLDREKR